jgi:hypothetical protein
LFPRLFISFLFLPSPHDKYPYAGDEEGGGDYGCDEHRGGVAQPSALGIAAVVVVVVEKLAVRGGVHGVAERGLE